MPVGVRVCSCVVHFQSPSPSTTSNQEGSLEFSTFLSYSSYGESVHVCAKSYRILIRISSSSRTAPLSPTPTSRTSIRFGDFLVTYVCVRVCVRACCLCSVCFCMCGVCVVFVYCGLCVGCFWRIWVRVGICYNILRQWNLTHITLQNILKLSCAHTFLLRHYDVIRRMNSTMTSDQACALWQITYKM